LAALRIVLSFRAKTSLPSIVNFTLFIRVSPWLFHALPLMLVQKSQKFTLIAIPADPKIRRSPK
jgi:hypothetical protein